MDKGARAHISVRPERLVLSDKPIKGESLKVEVIENVFVGTDITTHLGVENGPKLIVRTSNSARGNKRVFDPGTTAHVQMESGSARLLRD